MERPYGRLLAIQSVLALANATAGVFTITFLLKHEDFPISDVVVFSLLTFCIAPFVCLALVRSRPRSGSLLMATGLVVLASSYVAYLFAHGWPLLIYVGVAWGLYIPLFFVPFNTLVAETTGTHDRARRIGGVVLGYNAVAILAPALGGAVITAAGYSVVFSFAALVLIANVLLVRRLRVGRSPLPLSLGLSALGPRAVVSFLAQGGFESLLFGVGPLLAYQFTTEELGIGGLFSLFALAGGAITALLGVASDRLRDRRPFVLLGGIATAGATSLVVTATSLSTFALGNSIVTMFYPIGPVFLLTMAVDAMPARPAHAIVTREMLLNIGRTVSLAVYLVLLGFGVATTHGFAIAGVCMAIVAISRPRIAGNTGSASKV